MKKIKGFTKKKFNLIHKMVNTKELQENQDEVIEQQDIKSCFALVVVRDIPWYKRLFRSIRNFLVVYRWSKAR